jgi:hypothetical protein
MNLAIDEVGKSDSEFSTSEDVKLIINPLLSERLINNALGGSSFVKSLNVLIDVMSTVEVSPDDFSVVRVISPTKALLASVVEEGDTSCSQGENKCALE